MFCVCMYVCVSVCMRACKCVRACVCCVYVHVFVHVCVHACVRMCVCVCVCVCVCIRMTPCAMAQYACISSLEEEVLEEVMPLVLEEEADPGGGPFLLCGTLVDCGLAKSTSSSPPRDGAETHRENTTLVKVCRYTL